jgi:hypothetical protein
MLEEPAVVLRGSAMTLHLAKAPVVDEDIAGWYGC